VSEMFQAPAIGYIDDRVTRIDAGHSRSRSPEQASRGLPVVRIEVVNIHDIYYIHNRCE
jgi:hypothetical protein